MIFFAVLVLFFFARQAGFHMDPRTHEFIGDWRPVLLPKILYLNTVLLLLSSVTMERARQNIFREIDVLEEWLGLGRPALRRTLPWVGATLFLGLAFSPARRTHGSSCPRKGLPLIAGPPRQVIFST